MEEIFNLDWVRKSAGHEDVQDPKDGWYRERIRTGGSSLRVHIQPEGLTAEKGDMMLGYTDMRGNQGDTAVEEVFELDSTIPGSPCRKVRLDFKAGKAYKFQIFIPPGENEDSGIEGEHIIRGISQESETGETIWSFE